MPADHISAPSRGGTAARTFRVVGGKVRLEVVDGREEDLDVEDELFRLADGLEVLPAADLTQHVGYARRARLFERRQHPDANNQSPPRAGLGRTHVQTR